MTIEEASRQYHIPMKILREYESWGLCGAVKKVMGAWQYDDTDIERLSTILTLHDIGFTSREVETYMRLLLEQEGDHRARLRMLDQKRRPPWTTSISGKNSWSDWITCATNCESRRMRLNGGPPRRQDKRRNFL